MPAPKAALISFVFAAVAAILVMLANSLMTRSPLKPAEISRSLSGASNREITLRALTQVAGDIGRGDPSARQWYPAVLRLASNPDPALRQTSAWVMSHDPKSAEFHQALLKLLGDSAPLVRWNAAVALVRFGDAAGRPQFREMLRPFTVASPAPGILRYKRREHLSMDSGDQIATIENGAVTTTLAAPLTGLFDRRLVAEGGRVEKGDPIAVFLPGQEQVFEALRALAVVGTPDDLPDVERYLKPTGNLPENVQKQAKMTTEAIQKRFANFGPPAG